MVKIVFQKKKNVNREARANTYDKSALYILFIRFFVVVVLFNKYMRKKLSNSNWVFNFDLTNKQTNKQTHNLITIIIINSLLFQSNSSSL